MLTKQDLLKACTLQTTTFKSSLGEIKIRQLSITESKDLSKIQNDPTKDVFDVMVFTLSKAMVEPQFFTNEELEKLGKKGQDFMYEVFEQVPLIGMTENEIAEYKKRVEEYVKSAQNSTEKEEENIKK